MSEMPPQKALRWRVAVLCLALAAITFAVFGQTLTHDFIDFDDNIYVYANSKVAGGLSLKGLAWVFTHPFFNLYHPLTMLSLMGDYQLHGLHAGGYHFTNVLLHAASVILLFLVLRQMTGALWRSAFVAAVFAIHPLRVESVAWVAERKDVLSAFFFMLTLGAYARYVRKPDSVARYLMVAAAFVPALLSKPTVVTLPFVLLLLDYWPLRRFEQPGPIHDAEYIGITGQLILEKIPLLALAAGACAMNFLAGEQLIAGFAHVSMPSRLGNAVVSYVVYLRQMIWPEGLAPFYPQPDNGYPVWTMALSFLLLALITGGVLIFGRKRRWLLTGWLWYLGMLMPMIGIVQIGAFAHADRMTYLPGIGLVLAGTWAAGDWSAGWKHRRAALGGLMAAVIGALMVCAWIQTGYWKSDDTLWPHTLACTTRNYVAQNNLGNALLQKGKVDEAIAHFQKALEIQPAFGSAFCGLGDALDKKGRVDEAIRQYQKALESQPTYFIVHNALGLDLLGRGRVDEAITHFQQAVELRPDYVDAHINLGNAFLQKGNVVEAGAHFQKALDIKPTDLLGQKDQAWLMATCPDASLRNGSKAVALARQANALAGGENPLILHTLAAALAEAGRFPEAVETARRALRLAGAQSNTRLAGALESEMKLYQAGAPFHSPEQTH
jgi:Flp pilus assembly protein TadD